MPGYPRFRGKDRYDSFTYPQLCFNPEASKLQVSKTGDIKVKLHRRIAGAIKRLTLRRMPTVKWFACFSVETDVARSTRKEGSVAGVNVGLESFATLSEGEKVENPRFFKAEEKELAGVQRRLSKVPKGTPEREKALKVVERVQEKIANCILDFINKVSHALIDRFGVIAFEDLNIRDMLKNHNMAKSISDVAGGRW